jgi:hypothetical protein
MPNEAGYVISGLTEKQVHLLVEACGALICEIADHEFTEDASSTCTEVAALEEIIKRVLPVLPNEALATPIQK